MALAAFSRPIGPVSDYQEYTEADLSDPDTLVKIFDECQIYYASISLEGWDYLIRHYGYAQLHRIDLKSGWLTDRLDDPEDLEAYKAEVTYEIGILKQIEADNENKYREIRLTLLPEVYEDILAYAREKHMHPHELFVTAVQEYRRFHGDHTIPLYQLKLDFAWSPEGYLLSENRTAYERFGALIPPEKLGLSPDLCKEIYALAAIWNKAAAGGSPSFPKNWTDAEKADFERRFAAAIQAAAEQLGDAFRLRGKGTDR